MIKCASCRLPETYETIEFDAANKCNICHQHEFKNESINWEDRLEELGALIEQYRGKYQYDCIVPFSGGKDSTFTLYYLVETFKVRPLVVQFDHGFLRPNLIENNRRTIKRLGVDFHTFTPNWKLVKRLMRETLIRKGDFCWHCHTGIFSYPMHVALKEQVPLIFWGEPSSEYTAYFDYRDDEIEEVDEVRFNRFVNLGITAEDMRGMIASDFDLDDRDLNPFTYPKTRALKKLGYRSVCLGSYIPWDVKKQSALISKELGWQGDEVEGMPPGMYEYEKIECAMQGVRDYLKYLKRGYSRVSQMVALDVRNKRLSSAEADSLIEKFEGQRPASLDLFLEYLDMTEAEFNRIVSQLVVAPHQFSTENIRQGTKTKDFNEWYREK